MTEELKVVLRRSELTGFGFSLLGTTGPPHVIFDIIENSPAADCGAVEAGDVILKVNETDVHRYTTKEVLKCLRLSDDLVTLELKRDPKLKARIKEQLAKTKSPHYVDIESQSIYDYKGEISPTHSQTDSLNSTSSLRYKSTTNLPPQQTSANHSRSSSASSAKIQIADGYAAAGAGTITGTNTTTSTSPSTCRPSRIPTALKNPQKNIVQHSPQHKRPRPSQIPTKASIAAAAAANGNTTNSVVAQNLQHSNSYSGSGFGGVGGSSSRFQHRREQQQQEDECEPVTAPPQPKKAPRFEAYMMTGDLILNLSRTPQSSNLIVAHAKKVDSLRDSPNRAAARANGALAPRASGESSPTSSSSVESPTHSESSDSVNLLRKSRDKNSSRNQQAQHLQQQQQKQQQQQLQQQQQNQHSINNTISNNSSDRQCRKDSLTNDTLLLCEELDRDDEEPDIEEEEELVNDEYDYDNADDGGCGNFVKQHNRDNNRQQRYRKQQQQGSYEKYVENEEDQTNYDITNIDTYNSVGSGHYVGISTGGGGSEQQCLVMHDADDNDDDKDFHYKQQHEENEDLSACISMSSNSLASNASAKQRLRELKQKQKQQQQKHKQTATTTLAADSVSVCVSAPQTVDSVDCARETQRSSTQQQQHFCQHPNQHHHHHHHHHHHSSSSSSGGTVKSEGTSQDETSFSVPTSPISLSTPLLDKETANSVPTSPEPSNLIGGVASGGAAGGCNVAVAGSTGTTDPVVRRHNGVVRKCDSAGFRTSKSEDHLQQVQREGIAAVIPIDIDEDVNSSLNTLLDTRQDSEDSQPTQNKKAESKPGVPLSHRNVLNKRRKNASNRDRIVWTYNAPLTPQQLYQQQQQQHSYYGRSSPNSHSSSISSSSPHHTDSPASPTSVSSSVMSSSGSKGALGITCAGAVAGTTGAANSSYQQQQQQQQHLQLGQANAMGMVLSDPSDSDSTILVSDAVHGRSKKTHQQLQKQNEHKLVIQVRGFDSSNSNSPRSAYSEFKDSEDELATLTEEPPTLTTTTTSAMTVIAAAATAAGSGNNNGNNIGDNPRDGRDSSPPVSDDGSDVESLHSYHYSPKAVDMPSAIRLAKRLYSLDGFKKSDVSRHLSKNNDFSRAVADEYLKYFSFEKKTLDQSLREFLQQFALSGETQERERVLVHFSKRFLDCNPGSFNSQDAVHTLTCAIMLLNTDLHGQNIGRKMSCAEFVDNLAELNDGENFPKDVLKYLYQAIKSQPLEWALDEECADVQKQRTEINVAGSHIGQNPFLDIPETSAAVEYKKGYVMRKSCYEANYKKTPFGKRSWKMFYCTLRDLVLFLHKDEHGFRKSQMSDNLHNAIRIHHALATKATDYTKKQHVFRLQTADQAEYLFQTSDSKELQSWVETINFVCAAYSAPPLEGGVGSQKRFQRPLLPSTHTKLLMKEQLESHEQQVTQLENTLSEHKKGPIPSKGLPLQNYKEKESYLQYELRRYKSYVSILNAKLLADQQMELQIVADEESSDTFAVVGSGGLASANANQRTAHVIVAAATATNQSQSSSISGASAQQQQSANRKKEKRK